MATELCIATFEARQLKRQAQMRARGHAINREPDAAGPATTMQKPHARRPNVRTPLRTLPIPELIGRLVHTHDRQAAQDLWDDAKVTQMDVILHATLQLHKAEIHVVHSARTYWDRELRIYKERVAKANAAFLAAERELGEMLVTMIEAQALRLWAGK